TEKAAEAADVVSAAGGSAVATVVSAASGSGVAVLATDVAAVVAGSPAAALKDAAALVAPLSAVGVEAPKAVPHKIIHATTYRDPITGHLPPLGLEAGLSDKDHAPTNCYTIGSIVGSQPIHATAQSFFPDVLPKCHAGSLQGAGLK